MLNKKMSAGTKAEQSTKDETQVSAANAIGNTNVVGCQSPRVPSDSSPSETSGRHNDEAHTFWKSCDPSKSPLSEQINPDSKSLNCAIPEFSKNPMSVFKKHISPLRNFYIVRKQSVMSCGIKLTSIYLFGFPVYKSVFTSDED